MTASPAASVPEVIENSVPAKAFTSPYVFVASSAVIVIGDLPIASVPGMYSTPPANAERSNPRMFERTIPYVPTGALAAVGSTAWPSAFVKATSMPDTTCVSFVPSMDRTYWRSESASTVPYTLFVLMAATRSVGSSPTTVTWSFVLFVPS